MNADQELLAVFKAEAEEQIDQLSDRLSAPHGQWTVDKLFHLSHNIKGAARLVGVTEVRDVAHALEDLFGAIRDGLAISPEVVSLAREGAVLLEESFSALEGGKKPQLELFRSRAAALTSAGAAAANNPTGASRISEFAGEQPMLILFRAEVDALVDDLVERMKRPPSRWSIDRLKRSCREVCESAATAGADPAWAVASSLDDLYTAIDRGLSLDTVTAALARQGGGLLHACMLAIDRGQSITVGDFPGAVAELTGVSMTPGLPGLDGDVELEVADAPLEEVATPEADSIAGPAMQGETLRVGIDKLDTLMGLTSELIAEAHQADDRNQLANRLSARLASLFRRRPKLRDEPELGGLSHLLRELRQRLTDGNTRSKQTAEQLQESVRMLRMVRIDSLSGPYRKTLRDACRARDVHARLAVEGGQTEVDRAVLEHLRDPLIHLLRNAVAHGIETAPRRQAAGKRETGTVGLAARSAGAWVEITVSDDGRGIDPREIRRAAAGSRVVDRDELDSLNDDDVIDLIFRPGFTTVDSVSELAGRGVGLDVVRTNLGRLGGQVSARSTVGKGTTFSIKVPLTRLTTTGIVFRLGAQRFAATVSDVERTVQVARSQISTADGIDLVQVDERLLPVSHLATLFGLPANRSEKLPALVLAAGTRRRAVMVDEIIGQTEFIVQPLSWNLKGAHGLAGTAVMDGGEVILVLDGRELVHREGAVVSATGSRPELPSTRRHLILVVDDSVTSRTLERNLLTAAGYDVVAAVDGSEALDLLNQNPVDLVVADVEMPVMSGLDLTRKIRSDDSTRGLPIILVTSLGSEDDKRKGGDAGADAYIVKGEFDQEVLLRAVARLL